MKPSEKTQVRTVTSKVQAEAINRVSKQRGISKQALIREGIEAVTGVASGIATYPSLPPRGLSDPEHPYFRARQERRRRKEKQERAEAEHRAQESARRVREQPMKKPAG